MDDRLAHRGARRLFQRDPRQPGNRFGIDDAIRRGEAAIREARRAERENAVMIKPQPRGVRIDGWDV